LEKETYFASKVTRRLARPNRTAWITRSSIFFGYDLGSVQIRMSSLLPIYSLCFLLAVPVIAESQNLTSSSVLSFSAYQEGRESKRTQAEKGDAQSIFKATERLKRTVNGNFVVKNHCQVQGRSVEVEESTEIAEVDGCNLIVKTVKTSNPSDGRRERRFTFYANLGDLSTPASVEPLSFSQCKPVQGALVKVMSRAQPGKTVRTTRNSTSPPEGGQASTDQQETPARKDLSFFFSDTAIARRTARALDHAVTICGGKEWPDEDDLP
jgi:hypothetical protein